MDGIACNIYVKKITYKCSVAIDFPDMDLDIPKDKFIKGVIISLVYDLELGINLLSNDNIPYCKVDIFKHKYLHKHMDKQHYQNILSRLYDVLSGIRFTGILQLENIEILGNNVLLTIVELHNE